MYYFPIDLVSDFGPDLRIDKKNIKRQLKYFTQKS